ncbi:hypothetical protein ABBQ32_008284 [Trebouxia sp. C0010 RCD-2024]
MHSPLELRCCNNISGLHNPAPRTRRLRQQTPLICQTRSTNKGSGVVMRELPLPGSKTPQPINRATQMYVLEPAAQQASNGQTNSTWTAARQDAARQNSNLEASTSSSPNGVSFETHQQSSTARANDSVRNGNKRMLDAKTYDVTSSVNQAAPGFTTASRLAAASNDQRARSLIAEAESQSMPQIPLDSDFRWARDNYNSTQRSLDIWSFIISLRVRLYLLDQKWSYVGGWAEDKRTERLRSTAIWTRETLLSLGPTFIKVGQLFSTRSDLFSAAFTDELAKLQDRVPAFAPDKAVAIIESELGAPVSQLFRSFQKQPIAAASLGQVHRAVLHTGETVVVKVQRPGLKNLFDIDMANLKVLAKQMDRTDENSDFLGIYDEAEAILYKEIDYISEGKNADRFRRNFQDDSNIQVPGVYWQFTSPRVITLDYLPGTKITSVAALQSLGIDTATVARRATEAYLVQILKHGFLHSDPHPGNIAVNADGGLIFYDFGMMSTIVPATKDRLMDVFYGIYRKDAAQVVKALTDLKIIVSRGDDLSLRRAITYFLDNIARQTQEQETIAAIGEDIFAVALDQPFRFPATFTFVLRAFATLEGIGRALDANYKFVAVAQPYATKLLDLQDSQAQQTFVLEQVRKQAVDLGQATVAMPQRVEQISSTLSGLEGGEIKLRVRALEVERAARRASIMQVCALLCP